MSDFDKLLKKLGLDQYHGQTKTFFKETYRSTLNVKPLSDERTERSTITTIYVLTKKGEYGGWHRLKSDETFFYHRGNSIRMVMINPDDGQLKIVVVGDALTNEDAVYHYTVPANSWFNFGLVDKGGEDYGLVGISVTPGFDMRDTEQIDTAKLAELFPKHRQIIDEFSNEMKS